MFPPPAAVRPLRLLLVVDSLDGGGAEGHVVDLAVELARRGTDVTVACSVGGIREGALRAAGVTVRTLGTTLVKRRFSLPFARALRRLVREEGFDLVHAHIYASACASACATLGTGVPLVVTEHTEAPWRSRRARVASRATYARAGRVVAVSSALCRLLVGGYGLAPERVRLVAPAIPPPPAGDPHGAPRAPLPATRGPVVGLVGRLQPEKGVDVFLEAVADLAPLHADVGFLVIGDGPQRPRLETLAGRLGVADRVTFLGFRRDARALIARLDVLAVPSRSDGTPLVVFEAMAAGVPVVGSAVGGIPDQVRDGCEGLLVPPGDAGALARALGRILADPDRARFGSAGRCRAAQFSHQRMVDELEAIYCGVLPTAHQNLWRTGVV